MAELVRGENETLVRYLRTVEFGPLTRTVLESIPKNYFFNSLQQQQHHHHHHHQQQRLLFKKVGFKAHIAYGAV